MKLLNVKFLVDENISPILADKLTKLGYDTIHARNICKGESDFEVAKIAKKQNRIIITSDKDFGLIFYHQGIPVILLRLKYHLLDKMYPLNIMSF